MFGLGFGELLVCAVVLLIAVGPNRLPTFLKALGKGMREFRRTTRELREATGIDDLLEDEDLKELRKPLLSTTSPPVAPPRAKLTEDDLRREHPGAGPDVLHAMHLAQSAKSEDGEG